MAEEAEKAAERAAKCVKWSNGWAEANPDPVVADAIADGLVTLGCLPKSRLKRMLEREILDPETFTEGQMHHLSQRGLLDPEEAETVDDGDDEEEADDGDGGRASLDDLDEEAQERLVAQMEEEIKKQLDEMRASDADDGAGGDDVDEETGQEAETADDGDNGEEKADDGGDGDDGMISASQAM